MYVWTCAETPEDGQLTSTNTGHDSHDHITHSPLCAPPFSFFLGILCYHHHLYQSNSNRLTATGIFQRKVLAAIS